MRSLELKVPPPAVALVIAVLMWLQLQALMYSTGWRKFAVLALTSVDQSFDHAV